MRPRAAIYGDIANTYLQPGKGTFVRDIDSATLLSRLLFFDEVIIRSVRLLEVPFLVKLFGMEGLKNLMALGILKLSAEASTIMLDRHTNGKRELPLLQFRQGTVDVSDHRKFLSDSMSCLLQIPGLSNSNREALAETIKGQVVRPNENYKNDLLTQIQIDLRSNGTLLKRLLASKKMDLSLDESTIIIKAHEESADVQRFETNLHKLLGVSTEEEHNILTAMVKAVVNLNTRMADMAAYSAITSFETSEAPFLFGKIHGIVSPNNPSFDEKAFLRVLEFTDIPDLLVTGRIDTNKLLEIRQSVECKEFRSWLSSTDEMNDVELKRLLKGLRSRLALFINSKKGKTLRLMANATLGLLPVYGSVVSLTEGAVDTFLMDKLLPSPGALSFLNNSIPSVFENAYS
jgi:hypothetical protein